MTANHPLNPDASSAALLATRAQRLSVGLFAVILLITLLFSMNTIVAVVFGGRPVTPTRTIVANLVAIIPAAGLFGIAFGLIATRRVTALAVLVALPPTIATVALLIWLTPIPISMLWKLQLKTPAFFLLFAFTASLVDHFAAGITPKKRVTIGTVLFAGLAVASLVTSWPMVVILVLEYGGLFSIAILLIAFVAAIVLAIMLWRETRRRGSR